VAYPPTRGHGVSDSGLPWLSKGRGVSSGGRSDAEPASISTPCGAQPECVRHVPRGLPDSAALMRPSIEYRNPSAADLATQRRFGAVSPKSARVRVQAQGPRRSPPPRSRCPIRESLLRRTHSPCRKPRGGRNDGGATVSGLRVLTCFPRGATDCRTLIEEHEGIRWAAAAGRALVTAAQHEAGQNLARQCEAGAETAI
jgi:hypothetical protein